MPTEITVAVDTSTTTGAVTATATVAVDTRSVDPFVLTGFSTGFSTGFL